MIASMRPEYYYTNLSWDLFRRDSIVQAKSWPTLTKYSSHKLKDSVGDDLSFSKSEQQSFLLEKSQIAFIDFYILNGLPLLWLLVKIIISLSDLLQVSAE